MGSDSITKAAQLELTAHLPLASDSHSAKAPFQLRMRFQSGSDSIGSDKPLQLTGSNLRAVYRRSAQSSSEAAAPPSDP